MREGKEHTPLLLTAGSRKNNQCSNRAEKHFLSGEPVGFKKKKKTNKNS